METEIRRLAVKDSEMVAVAETYDDLYRALKEQRVDGAYVFYSPTERDKGYGFLFVARPWR